MLKNTIRNECNHKKLEGTSIEKKMSDNLMRWFRMALMSATVSCDRIMTHGATKITSMPKQIWIKSLRKKEILVFVRAQADINLVCLDHGSSRNQNRRQV